MYPHLFSTQKTNVSDLLTSDSPAIFLSRLASVLLAVATLPLWEGLFRHTDPTPSSEKIKMSCCRAASSMIALYFKRSQRKMSYHPCPGEVSRNDARHIDGRWRRGVPTITRQLKFKEQKCRGIKKAQPMKTFSF